MHLLCCRTCCTSQLWVRRAVITGEVLQYLCREIIAGLFRGGDALNNVCNIPLFYQAPNERHIFQSNMQCLPEDGHLTLPYNPHQNPGSHSHTKQLEGGLTRAILAGYQATEVTKA